MTVITITIGIVLVVGIICNTINERMRIKSNETVKMFRIKLGKEKEENERTDNQNA